MAGLRWRSLGALLAGLFVAWTALRTPAAAPEGAPVVMVADVSALRGAGSCAATACHGSIAPVPGAPVLRDEYTTWASRDKHARAYQVLFSSRSRAIARNLGRNIPAHRDNRCLACHASAGTAAAPESLLEDGVGCESCHGPSARWVGPHTSYEWQSFDDRTKSASFGMKPLRSVSARAETCVACHVGASGRDVDHDLIAAGHPRLAFEYAAYADLMPRHWVDKGADVSASAPARAWLIGQAVSAKAALELLHERARKAESNGSQWPEFAEYGCFACHRDLRDAVEARSGHEPAEATWWGTWYYATTEVVANCGPTTGSDSLRSHLEAMREAMRPAEPNPRRVADLSARTAHELQAWLTQLEQAPLESADIRRLLDATNALGRRARGARSIGWDLEAQRFLALVPLRQALELQDPSRVEPSREEIAKLLEHLRFPAGYDSPGRPGTSQSR